MSEEWRPVVGHHGYEVSSLGRVRNARTGHIQQKKPYPSGAIMATFGGSDRELLHRVVLRAFRGEPAEGEEGSHLNGDPTDNRVENLAWEDHLSNMRRKHEHGTTVRGEAVNTAKLTEPQILGLRADRRNGMRLRELAEKYGISVRSVSNIIKRRSWKHVA